LRNPSTDDSYHPHRHRTLLDSRADDDNVRCLEDGHIEAILNHGAFWALIIDLTEPATPSRIKTATSSAPAPCSTGLSNVPPSPSVKTVSHASRLVPAWP